MKLANLSLQKNVKYNNTLHPKIWDGERLKRDVRKKLIEIAESFVEFIGVKPSVVEDYIIVGSSANYNWNEYSDIDLHVVMDFSAVAETCNDEIVEEYLRDKRELWLKRFDIDIDGVKVEVSPQDINAELESSAVYSVLENRWIKKPKVNEPDINQEAYEKKLKDILERVSNLLKNKPKSEDIDNLLDEIKKMRRSSLASGGEFAVNNLVFKTLRNQGVIEKLSKMRDDKKSEELSL